MNVSFPRSVNQLLNKNSNSLDAVREQFERTQHASITKAMNAVETQPKEKHVRIIIIGTFQERSSQTFWNESHRLPLQGHPVVCWKFCYVLHKLLRESHHTVLPESLQQRDYLRDLGRLWGHLGQGYGPLIARYCHLLKTKLDFHQKNPGFPGNLELKDEELTKLVDNDANNYFQLGVELFDYLEDVLKLEEAIFSTFSAGRSNSVTHSGQCRSAPLVLCILDSCQLYDMLVKSMFRLHSALDPDLLSGHNHRFKTCFGRLKNFYAAASKLQYLRGLIEVPKLPETMPNFAEYSNLRLHRTPVATVHQYQRDDTDGSESTISDAPSNSTITNANQFDGMLIDASDPHDNMQNTAGRNSSNNSRSSHVLDDEDAFFGWSQQQQMQLAEHQRNFAAQYQPPVQPPSALPVASSSSSSVVDGKSHGAEELIESLLREINSLKSEIERIKNEDRLLIDELSNQVNELEAELSAQQHLLTEASKTEQALRRELQEVSAQQAQFSENHAVLAADSSSAAASAEAALKQAEKADEKFKKMQKVYNDLRDEHVNLIRQNAAAQKQQAEATEKRLRDDELERQELYGQVEMLKHQIADLEQQQQSERDQSAARLQTEQIDARTLAGLLQNEMHQTDEAVMFAANRIEEILRRARDDEQLDQIKLRVNENILDGCGKLITAVRELIKNSRTMQQEIVAAGRDSGAPPEEFYQKNHKWTEGVISAAKTVGQNASFLVETADRVLSQNGKLEEVIVASQQISASTAQLCFASRVKADKNSEAFKTLSSSGKRVTQETANVIASTKSCSQWLAESEEQANEMDFMNMPLHKVKRLEMDCQVKVLELETDVEKQRRKLAQIRKAHYQLAGPSEGWDLVDAEHEAVGAGHHRGDGAASAASDRSGGASRNGGVPNPSLA